MPQPQNGLEISGVELLQRVASFYENAWANLIFLVTIFLIFVGVIIPILIQWHQRRSFRIEEESLKQEIRKQVEEIRVSLSTELSADLNRREEQQQTQLDSKIAEVRGSLNKQALSLQGHVYNVQGAVLFTLNNYGLGLASYLRSAIDFAQSERESALQGSLSAIIKTGLPKIENEAINSPELGLVELFDELISTLEKNNDRGRYIRSIGKLKSEWQKANGRSPEPTGRDT